MAGRRRARQQYTDSQLSKMSNKQLKTVGYIRVAGFTKKDGTKVKSHIRNLSPSEKSTRDTEAAKEVAGNIIDFVPIIGDAKALLEAKEAFEQGNIGTGFLLAGAGVVGLVPGIGDGIGVAIRRMVKLNQKAQVTDQAITVLKSEKKGLEQHLKGLNRIYKREIDAISVTKTTTKHRDGIGYRTWTKTVRVGTMSDYGKEIGSKIGKTKRSIVSVDRKLRLNKAKFRKIDNEHIALEKTTNELIYQAELKTLKKEASSLASQVKHIDSKKAIKTSELDAGSNLKGLNDSLDVVDVLKSEKTILTDLASASGISVKAELRINKARLSKVWKDVDTHLAWEETSRLAGVAESSAKKLAKQKAKRKLWAKRNKAKKAKLNN